MNDKQVKYIITELSSCEKQLDTVLFARRDDDDDYSGIAEGAAGATALGGTLGAGAYLRGRQGLRRPAAFTARDIGSTIGRGVSEAAGDIKQGSATLWENLLKAGKKGAGVVGRGLVKAAK